MKTIILGAGLSGLSAGYKLSEAGEKVVIIEKESQVGGLSRTISFDSCLFDLGGHRFLTEDKEIEKFIKKLIGNDLLKVPRESKIFFENKLIDYPVRPLGVLKSVGLMRSLKILGNYSIKRGHRKNPQNLKEWMVNNFGTYLFDIYFREYTEKVLGIPAEEISIDWADKRIGKSSLWNIFKNSLKTRGELKTTAQTFYYPKRGIGQIADALKEKIENGGGKILLDSEMTDLKIEGGRITKVVLKTARGSEEINGDNFISTVPINQLVEGIKSVPNKIWGDVLRLKYRSLIILFLHINKPTITDNSWVYFHKKTIPFARFHEPKNWSSEMVKNQSEASLVLEYFCNIQDRIWQQNEEDVLKQSVKALEDFGFLQETDVISYKLLKLPFAYPVYSVDYKKHLSKVKKYLGQFYNLRTIGRMGTFNYNGIDDAVESGFDVAEKILQKGNDEKI